MTVLKMRFSVSKRFDPDSSDRRSMRKDCRVDGIYVGSVCVIDGHIFLEGSLQEMFPHLHAVKADTSQQAEGMIHSCWDRREDKVAKVRRLLKVDSEECNRVVRNVIR